MELLKLNGKNYQKVLRASVRAIKNGRILVCPTDTVYGLVCNANSKKAVAKIFSIKQRSKNKPLPIFVKNIRTAEKLAVINKNQEKFLKKVWPGKTTAVLKNRKGGAIGLRIPDHKFVLGLAERTGPLAETSANISGEPPTAKIKEVLKCFKGRQYQPDLVIDAGDLKPSKPSRVVDLTGSKPRILRK